MSKPRRRVDVPFVSARLPGWSGVSQNVLGSTVTGATVQPTNYPLNVCQVKEEPFVTIPPNADPMLYFNVYPVLFLMPGVTYRWPSIQLHSNTIINGQGAVVFLQGDGPLFNVAASDSAIEPVSLNIHFNNINFFGGQMFDRSEDMSINFVPHSAIWITDVWKTTISNCSFNNFKGAAVFYKENGLAPSELVGQQQHLVTGCKFTHCRIAIANSGFSEYSVASTNSFYDCHIAFHVYGGYWLRSNNLINKCGAGFFHNQNNMWYLGQGQYNVSDLGTFSNNIVHRSDTDKGNLWPSTFKLTNNSTVTLAGMYCNSSSSLPPLYLGNSHFYSSFDIINLPGHIYCVTGCKFYGTEGSTTYSYIKVPQTFTNNIYFLGCFGNGVRKVNISDTNMTPVFGRSTRMNSVRSLDSETRCNSINEICEMSDQVSEDDDDDGGCYSETELENNVICA